MGLRPSDSPYLDVNNRIKGGAKLLPPSTFLSPPAPSFENSNSVQKKNSNDTQHFFHETQVLKDSEINFWNAYSGN